MAKKSIRTNSSKRGKPSKKAKSSKSKQTGGGTQGAFEKEDFGFSLPLDQPLYPKPPIEYRDATILTYVYHTDVDAAAALLPSKLTLKENPIVKMVFANYQWSSVGFYNEVVQALECQYKGTDYLYPVRLHVTTDRAMSSGREIGGFPKKMGHIEFSSGAQYYSALESPVGAKVCSGEMQAVGPTMQLRKGMLPPSKYLSLRVIPNPFDDAPPVCELIESSWLTGDGESWVGLGSFHFDRHSELDPYHRLPVVKPIQNSIFHGDMVVEDIKLLERF